MTCRNWLLTLNNPATDAVTYLGDFYNVTKAAYVVG